MKKKRRANEGQKGPSPEVFYQSDETSIDGDPYSFEQLRGKLIFVTNIATKCDEAESEFELLKGIHETYGDRVVLLCFPTAEHLGHEVETNEAVKEFALQRVPEGLTLLQVASLETRPAWPFPLPVSNFGGKWIVGGIGGWKTWGRVVETTNPIDDIAKIIADDTTGGVAPQGGSCVVVKA